LLNGSNGSTATVTRYTVSYTQARALVNSVLARGGDVWRRGIWSEGPTIKDGHILILDSPASNAIVSAENLGIPNPADMRRSGKLLIYHNPIGPNKFRTERASYGLGVDVTVQEALVTGNIELAISVLDAARTPSKISDRIVMGALVRIAESSTDTKFVGRFHKTREAFGIDDQKARWAIIEAQKALVYNMESPDVFAKARKIGETYGLTSGEDTLNIFLDMLSLRMVDGLQTPLLAIAASLKLLSRNILQIMVNSGNKDIAAMDGRLSDPAAIQASAEKLFAFLDDSCSITVVDNGNVVASKLELDSPYSIVLTSTEIYKCAARAKQLENRIRRLETLKRETLLRIG
jgi:hypothetical protein